MKLLAFTDTHGEKRLYADLKEKSRGADIAVCCGDFTEYGEDIQQHFDFLESLHSPVLLIHGNHESEQVVRNLEYSAENVSFIHRRIYEEEQYAFIGYGGLGFDFKTSDFESFIKETTLPNKELILVTHQPPHRTALDYPYDSHVGNNSFRKFCDAHGVTLCLSGHIHECFGMSDESNGVEYLNPGPEGVILSL